MERLAIIGGGISGLACGYRLQKDFDITVFEKESILGGHAKSFVTPRGSVINPYVFGYVRGLYKNFFDLMEDVGFDGFVGTPPLYIVIHNNGKILHADIPMDLRLFLRNIPTYLDPRKPPSFLHWARFFRFLAKFRRDYYKGRFPQDLLVEDLVRYYPDHKDIITFWAFPFAFLKSQVTLQVNDLAYLLFESFSIKSFLKSRELYVVTKGGVHEYIEHLASKIRADIKTSAPIQKLERVGGGWEIVTANGDKQRFDRVIVATQPRDVRKFLKYSDDTQRALFEDIERYYDPTMVVVHTDPDIFCGIPKRLWGVGGSHFDPVSRLNTVTMYEPRITGTDEDVFVTYMEPYDIDLSKAPDWASMGWNKLPDGSRIDPKKVLDARVLMHPLWGDPGQKARFRQIYEYSGRAQLYFTGVGLDGKNSVGHEGACAAAAVTVERIRASAKKSRPAEAVKALD